jgi:glycosyltransferase involved in cell wall biosynthesis
VKPKVLFISGFLPSNRVPSGGQKLVYDVLEELSEKHALSLVTFCNEREKPYLAQTDYHMCADVSVFPIGTATRVGAAMLLPTLPLITSARFLAARRKVRQCLATGEYASVWIEFIQAASFLALLPRQMPSTLVVHDIFHEALERRAGQSRGLRSRLWRLEAARTRTWEKTILEDADQLITLNEKDRDTIAQFAKRSDVTVRYPVVEKRFYNISRREEQRDVGTILFWAMMSRAENEDAALWFASKILPEILKSVPKARFVIAGANPTDAIRNLASASVQVLGFVEDPIPLFASVHLAVAPLRMGSGIKIKVVEYLAASIPTVATSVGSEGIRSSPLLHVADDPAAFAVECIKILQN